MSYRTPYILLSFANPINVPQHYLPSLNKESKVIYQHLEPFTIKSIIDIYRNENTTIEDLFNTIERWDEYRELLILHYGGHASGAKLLLNTDNANSKSVNAHGLAKLLGSLSSLKLVFLNACSTYEQVKILLDQGVKAVIATSEPVNDRMATDFADRFYQNLSDGKTIKESFERAKNFISSKYEEKVFASDEYRDFVLDDFESLEEKDSLPWGLYCKKGTESNLNWSLSRDSQTKSLFGEADKFTCNRQEQNETFKLKFNGHKFSKKVQTYFIHGQEMQSPEGLFKRFVYKEIRPTYHQVFDKIIKVEEANTFEGAKMELTNALFNAIGIDHYQLPLHDRTMEKVFHAPALRNKDCVAIKFKYFSSAWKPFTGEFIQWFLEEFIDEKGFHSEAPNFIFFFSVVYREITQNKGVFSRFFQEDPKKKIIKTLKNKNFQKVTILRELPSVKRDDIDTWMEDLSDGPLEKKEYMEKHFSDKKEWEMTIVEKELGKIIDKYNDKNINQYGRF